METPQIFSAASLNPVPATSALKLQFVGQKIDDVQTPAAIVDAAVVKKNCKLMLETVEKLGVEFRAHVKTHKTVEIAKLQVGDRKAVNLVCSTVSEIENLLPWLLECKSDGRKVNVLYGLPISLSHIPRLARIARLLGKDTIGLFIDHPAQLQALDHVDESFWPGRIPVWVPIDVGYHREGVAAGSKQLANIAQTFSKSERSQLAGLYAHFGSSYNSSSPQEALQYMATELQGLKEGADSFLNSLQSNGFKSDGVKKVILSIGTTPTVTSTYNLFDGSDGVKEYREMLHNINQSFAVELHAGVYPFMDMQQLATRARPQDGQIGLSFSEIGFRILAEVVSLYLDRGEKPEALIAAGSIALGREPCKSYEGWGVITPWPSKDGSHYDPETSRTGWIVGRISQEHGVLAWEGPKSDVRPLRIGQKVMVWPNHACIAGINFGFYLVVDSDTGEPDRIQDVWVRSRGW